MLRFLSFAWFLVAAVLIAAAGYSLWASADAPGAFIEDQDQPIVGADVVSNDVTYRLRNPTRHKVRVVGFTSC